MAVYSRRNGQENWAEHQAASVQPVVHPGRLRLHERKGWMTEWITGVDLSTTLISTVPGFLGNSALAVV